MANIRFTQAIMWRESQLQVGCTNTNHLQMTHDGSGLHTAAPRFAIPQKLTKVSVSEFSMILTCGFPKVLLALCSSQTLIKARFAAKVASSLFESWWMSCSFHAVSKLNPMCEKVSETSPRLHFLVDSKLVPRDPARKY